MADFHFRRRGAADAEPSVHDAPAGSVGPALTPNSKCESTTTHTRQWILSKPDIQKRLSICADEHRWRADLHRPHPHAAGRTAAAARADRAGGSVSSGVRRESGLDFDRAAGGVRTERVSSPGWGGNRARRGAKLPATLKKQRVFSKWPQV